MAEPQSFLTGGGEMGARVRAFDWSATPLGPLAQWPPMLRAAVGLCVHSVFPTMVYWGADFRTIYNDAFIELLGRRHPRLGEPGAQVWPELWPGLLPTFETMMKTGESASSHDRALMIVRDGRRVESWWNSSYTPIVDDDGTVRGLLSQPREITEFVLQRRFDSLMLALDAQLIAAETPMAKMDVALALIGTHLGVKRTGYGEVDVEREQLRIMRCWTSGTMPDISGEYPLGTFGGPVSAALRNGETVVIEDNLTDPRTADPVIRQRYAGIALRSGIVVPILDRGRYVGGVFVQDDEPRRWTAHQTALAEAAARRLWQALVRARAEAALRESEERHRLIFEQSHDIIFTIDRSEVIRACNPAAADALGYRRDAIIGRSVTSFAAPGEVERNGARLRQALLTEGALRYDTEVVGSGGRRMRWEINATLARDRDDMPIGMHAVARDVTERRAFDERRELLIHELNHRVKNTLALVQGLAHQSFRPSVASDVAHNDFLARLAALAAAHDLLTRDQWEGVTIAELVRGATDPVSGNATRIFAEGPALTVKPRAAVAIVMALHELATNAVKYGALSVPEGRIDIAWQSNPDGRFRMVWTETGGPAVAAPSHHGFGVKMIERALASDLGGTVTVAFAPKGVICTIDAPLAGREL